MFTGMILRDWSASLGVKYNAQEWRVIIEYIKIRHKAVLLHNENKKFSLHIESVLVGCIIPEYCAIFNRENAQKQKATVKPVKEKDSIKPWLKKIKFILMHFIRICIWMNTCLNKTVLFYLFVIIRFTRLYTSMQNMLTQIVKKLYLIEK